MDQTLPTDNPEPEGSNAGDYATRRIDPDELFAATGQEHPTGSEAKTELVTQAEDPAATKVINEIPEPAPPAPEASMPPTPVVPVQPAASPPPAAPKKDDRTQMAVIIAVAAVVLVCICACTAIALTAIFMIPNF